MRFFIFPLLALFTLAPHTAFAATCDQSTPGSSYIPGLNGTSGTYVCPGGTATNVDTVTGTVTASPTISAPSTPVLSGGLGFVPLAPVPGLTTGMVADSAGITNFLNNLYKYLIGIAAVLAVVEIIWGGLEIATKDSVSKKSDGKKRIWQALMGLALVLSPALVFGIINPAILNMSISMVALNVQNRTGAGSGTQTADTPAGNTAATSGTTAGTGAAPAGTAPTTGNGDPGTGPAAEIGVSASATPTPSTDEILHPQVFSTASAVTPGSSCTVTTDNVYYCWANATVCGAAISPSSILGQESTKNGYSFAPCKQF